MFSNRLPERFDPTSLARALGEKRRAGAHVLDLTNANPTQVDLPCPGADMLAAIGGGSALEYAPSPRGLPAARLAVADYYSARGAHIDPDHILLTSSTSEAYALLLKLLASPGDALLVPRPGYPLLDALAALESVTLRQYPLSHDRGWRINLGALEAAVTPHTRALVLVHPNNPTGSYVKLGEPERLGPLARRHELALISDEVFHDYAFGADPSRAGTLAAFAGALTFTLSGLSKVCGLPQMKLAWICISGPEPLRTEAQKRLEYIADAYLSVGAPVQHAAQSLLTLRGSFQATVSARLAQNRRHLGMAVASARGVQALESEGGWHAILQLPSDHTDEEWALELLRKDDILVQPGYLFGFDEESRLVISLITPSTEFQDSLSRLLARVRETLGT